MAKVLFTGGVLEPKYVAMFSEANFDVAVVPSDLKEGDLIHALADCDGYVLAGVEKVTADVLRKANRLRVIAFMGVGYQSFVDAEYAAKLGIAVTNAPGANAAAVAEFTVALMLDAVRQSRHHSTEVKAGRWKEPLTGTVIGKTVGIVGCGAIGSKVARMVHDAFGTRILYYSRSPKPELEHAIGARYVELHQLLREADIVSLHVSYSPKTIGLLGTEELKIIKQGSIIICTARPETLDIDALKDALRVRRVRTVAIDGYYKEPAPAPETDQFGLLALDESQTIITPHMASLTDEAIEKTLKVNIRSIANVLSGLDDNNIVNPSYRNNNMSPSF